MNLNKCFKQLLLNNIKPKKIILFESHPDFSCNTEPVFLYLQKTLPDYKFVWICHNKNSTREGCVCVYRYPKKLIDNIKIRYYKAFCKVAISSNKSLRKITPHQISLFLGHGSKTKKTRGFYEMGEAVDYINVQSHFFDDVTVYEYNCSKSQLVYLGYPRCDYYYKPRDIAKICNAFQLQTKLFAIWLPTFRKQKTTDRNDGKGGNYDCIGMPLIYNIEQMRNFNDYLKALDISIIFKPHPAQDISVLKAESLSNIILIDDAVLSCKGIQLYEVIAASSALITDYSSVFFDYLLLDQPIATTTDDIDIWKQNRGFAFDLESLYNQASTRVKDVNELQEFLKNVVNRIDEKHDGRQRVCEMTNIYRDGESAKRVGDFVIQLLDKNSNR